MRYLPSAERWDVGIRNQYPETLRPHGSAKDPIFRTVDGSNCDHSIDVSTLHGREEAYSLLRTRGLIRVAIAVPANANYRVVSVSNPYGCNESDTISMYRRPLPTTNLRFLSAVMFDGRESTPVTGTTKISYANYPDSLVTDLKHQSVDATTNHAQGDGSRPTADEQQKIVDFEMALTTAQAIGDHTGLLTAHDATGGPMALVDQPFFISINSSVNPLVHTLETPGGMTPGDGKFTLPVYHFSTRSTHGRNFPTAIRALRSRVDRPSSIPESLTSQAWRGSTMTYRREALSRAAFQ